MSTERAFEPDPSGESARLPSTSSVTTLLPITKAARNALTPAEGMFIFQSDNTPGPRFYTNGHWQKVTLATDD